METSQIDYRFESKNGKPDRIPRIAGVLTDSYGTIFDAAAIHKDLEGIVPDPKGFAKQWFETQTLWTVALGSMGQHAYYDWWALTHRTFHWLVRNQKLDVSDAQAKQAVEAWLAIPPYDDVHDFFQRLKEAGIPAGILSNGSPNMLEAAVKNAGLQGLVEHVVSVERVQTYKASPQVYLIARDMFGNPPNESILFISGHGYDHTGASAVGLVSVYLNRKGEPMWDLGYPADYEVEDMRVLADAIVAGANESR
jgi:2-haloacid dehalogenase